MAVITSVRLERDADVSHARRSARTIVGALGRDLHDQTRFATAVSEIARNALQYAQDGRVEFSIDRAGRRTRLLATVSDAGQGIGDLEAVLGGVYRSEQGLGLGLRGARRIADHFDIATGKGGTVIELGLILETDEDPAALSRRAADALAEAARRNPVDELTEQNRALRDAYARQAFLQRELHHRTKNNLAIIHSYAAMQARQVESPEARAALLELAGRVHALGLVHSFLHHSDVGGQIDLCDYLGELASSLTDALGGDGAQIECEVEPVPVDPDCAVEIGIIVNELVTNAVKHARPPCGGPLIVTVDVSRKSSALTVLVSDNGAGLEKPEETLRDARSLGWRVVQASVQKLGAELALDGGDGLTATVTIPL